MAFREFTRTDASVRNRFLLKVRFGPGCWEWTGARQRVCKIEYGRFGLGGSRSFLAHRVAWSLFFGPVPLGLEVCHHCDNGLCVRPDHLFTGTHQDNMSDMAAKGRGAGGAGGEENGMSKLTADDVRLVRSSTASGPELARSLGVDTSTVNRVRRGETWRHVCD